jgi:uncharacterized membrane protein
MLEFLGHWFAAVCGQGPGHTWAPGGILLPCCQRCTGLYVGAGIAALLHLGLRPRLSGRLLQIHGGFLLVMVPLGFHWVAQGPVLRSLSGVLFGFGVVTFLWLKRRKTQRNLYTSCAFCAFWRQAFQLAWLTSPKGETASTRSRHYRYPKAALSLFSLRISVVPRPSDLGFRSSTALRGSAKHSTFSFLWQCCRYCRPRQPWAELSLHTACQRWLPGAHWCLPG